MEKATLGFRLYKIWQNLKRFAGTFHQAQTLKLGGVRSQPINSIFVTVQSDNSAALTNQQIRTLEQN